jgi:F0F1-type ATP synthase membrane subunit c/vacuolar-type H+-ATPase subunit K
MSLGLDETKGRDVEREREADASHRALRIIWLAILSGVIALFVVTRVVQPSSIEGGNIMFWMLWALGLTVFGASFVLKHKLQKQAVEKQQPGMVRSAYIIAFALCEATGLFGLLAHLLTGVKYYYLFFVLGGFGILLHKPQRDDLLAAMNGGGIREAGKND